MMTLDCQHMDGIPAMCKCERHFALAGRPHMWTRYTAPNPLADSTQTLHLVNKFVHSADTSTSVMMPSYVQNL